MPERNEMTRAILVRSGWCGTVAVLLTLAAQVAGQQTTETALVERTTVAADVEREKPSRETEARTEAQKQQILQMTREGYERMADIRDYTCLLVKRERVEGVLLDYEFMQAKVRHARQSNDQTAPFSVYLKFLAPADVKGREVLYVEGHNDGKIIARKGGTRFAYITTEIEPESDLALEDNRYPITEFGIENLVKRFLEHVEGSTLADCTIQIMEGAKVDDRACQAIQVTKNRRTDDAQFYLARVYIDQELGIPIHYEAFDWPRREGEEPRLIEQYTYRNVRLNVGLTDADFRRDNPAYGFRNK